MNTTFLLRHSLAEIMKLYFNSLDDDRYKVEANDPYLKEVIVAIDYRRPQQNER